MKVIGLDFKTHLFHHNFHRIAVAALHLYQLAAGAAFNQFQQGVQVQLPEHFTAPELGKVQLQLGGHADQGKGKIDFHRIALFCVDPDAEKHLVCILRASGGT